MTSYVTPKKNAAFITYVSLEDQANAGLFKTSPTLAAGDFKVSIDGGALNNLATLPTNTPAGSAMVKISLSADEMNGDNITVVCKDAAGDEWYDLVLNIQTTAAQIDDLATSAALATVDGIVDDILVDTGTTLDTLIKDIPTNAEFEARTLVAADYVVVGDTLAAVTTVGSVTGAVGSVTAPVTAGTVSDKTGYALTAAYDAAKTAATQASVDVVDGIVDDLLLVAPDNKPTVAATGEAAVNVTYSAGVAVSGRLAEMTDLATLALEATAQAILDDTGTTLPAQISLVGGGAGSGAISHTITIENENGPVDGAEVWITTDEPGANVVAGTLSTDVFGNVTFMLDAGDYYAWVQRAPDNFPNPTLFTVS